MALCLPTALLLVLAVAAPAHASLDFLIMGDWGGVDTAPWTTPAEVQTAAGMQKVAAEVNATCALALGGTY